jgi:hypothetical protein
MSEFARVMGKDVDQVQVDIQDGTKHMVNVFWDVKPDQVPMRDEAKSILQRRMQNPQEFPQTQCLPLSVPMAMFVQYFKIVQAPRQMVMLFEAGDPARQIYTDGRSLPKDPQPSWMGYSAARWEGDTLVVETAGFNSKGWIDFLGHPRSESMRITERYRRRDFGHMDLEMTFEDPKYYSQPFSIKTGVNLVPDSDVLDYVCTENEKDRVHLETR